VTTARLRSLLRDAEIRLLIDYHSHLSCRLREVFVPLGVKQISS
jgi:hypothetical protein